MGWFKNHKNNEENRALKFIEEEKYILSSMNLVQLKNKLDVINHKIGKDKYFYKNFSFTQVFITIIIAVYTILNAFNNSTSNVSDIIKLNELRIEQNALAYKDDDKKQLEENKKELEEIRNIVLNNSKSNDSWQNTLKVGTLGITALGVTIYVALSRTGYKISENETRVRLIEKEIDFKENETNELSADIVLLKEKDISGEVNIDSEFDEKLLLYKDKLSEEEKVKRLRLLKAKLEHKKENIDVANSDTYKFIASVLLNGIIAISAIVTFFVPSLEKLSFISGSIYITFVLICILVFIINMFKTSEKEHKKQKDIQGKNKKQKDEICIIRTEIEVLKYLLYIENKLTIEV